MSGHNRFGFVSGFSRPGIGVPLCLGLRRQLCVHLGLKRLHTLLQLLHAVQEGLASTGFLLFLDVFFFLTSPFGLSFRW